MFPEKLKIAKIKPILKKVKYLLYQLPSNITITSNIKHI